MESGVPSVMIFGMILLPQSSAGYSDMEKKVNIRYYALYMLLHNVDVVY